MWDLEKYMKEQIEGIKKLQAQGKTIREIMDTNEFCDEALEEMGFPISYLIPKEESQEVTWEEFNTHSSQEWKWELAGGIPFASAIQRDRVLIGLLYSCGFKHLLEILPDESIVELKKAIDKLQR